MRRHLILAVMLLCVTSVGCAVRGSAKYEEYRTVVDDWSYPKYVWVTTKDLVLDALDIVSVEMAFGPSFLVDVVPTEVLEVGGGYADIGKIGWRNRMLGFWKEQRLEAGFSMWYWRSLQYEPVFGTTSMWDFPPLTKGFTIRNNEDRHWMDVGAQANILFGGFGAWVSPMQTVDFLANAFQYPYNIILRRPLYLVSFYPPEFDYANDDTPAQVRAELDYKLLDPGRGFVPAEVVDEVFRIPY